MITLLQISDIHFHSFPGEDEDEYANMRARLFDDLDYVREHFEPINTILICGDIAFSGKKNEYDIAHGFLKSMLVKLTKDGAEPKVFTVPGNHDKDRSVYEETRYLLNTALLNQKQAEANKLFNKFRSSEESTLKILYAPLKEYNNFASFYSSTDEIADSIINDIPLKGKSVFSKRPLGSLGEYAVSLIGLNSTLCCDQYDFSTKFPEKSHSLFLPKVACNQVKSKYDIFISLMHHPITDFILNGDKLQAEFDLRYNVQLFGHIHKQSTRADNNIKIYSGAFQPDENDDNEYFPVYNIITLEVNGNELTVAIKSRKWNGVQFVNYPEGSETHTISLEPINTWTDEEKEKAVAQKQEVADMDKKYKVQKMFMDCIERKRIKIMRDCGYDYDNKKSGISNSVLFLKWIDKENKWDELESKML